MDVVLLYYFKSSEIKSIRFKYKIVNNIKNKIFQGNNLKFKITQMSTLFIFYFFFFVIQYINCVQIINILSNERMLEDLICRYNFYNKQIFISY